MTDFQVQTNPAKIIKYQLLHQEMLGFKEYFPQVWLTWILLQPLIMTWMTYLSSPAKVRMEMDAVMEMEMGGQVEIEMDR